MAKATRQFQRLMMILAVLALSACTLPRFQPLQPEIQPPQLQEKQWIAGDGVTLPLQQWLPEKTPVKAVIVALHGFNDYSNAFALPGAYFAEHGVAVMAYDQRGFGRTHPAGIWGGQENLIRDVSQIIAVAGQRYPGIPLYLLGESMGGAIAIAAATSSGFPQDKVQGIILSAPALWGGNSLNPLHRFLLWVSAHNLPHVKLTGKGIRIRASDNTEMLLALGRDPLVIKQTRIDAIYGLVQLMDRAQENIAKVRSPLLLLYGQHDQVIPPKAIAAALDTMEGDLTLALYDTGWHMLLRDLQAKRVWDDILAWINHPRQPLPSAAQLRPGDFRKTFQRLKVQRADNE